MYPPGDDKPLHGAGLGHRIEHKLMPGFVMKVDGIKGCETGPARPGPARAAHAVQDHRPRGQRLLAVCLRRGARPVNETFVTITSAAAGNDQDGFRIGYYWDGRTFGTKLGAVSNGFKLVRCDDFNIGVVRKGELVSLWWMDECLSENAETLDRISVECGLAW